MSLPFCGCFAQYSSRRRQMVAVLDFLVQSPDGTPQLVVESKSRTAASAEWAALMRRNLFAHLPLPHAPISFWRFPSASTFGRTRRLISRLLPITTLTHSRCFGLTW